MKTLVKALLSAVLSAAQIIILPINFALAATLFFVSRQGVAKNLVLILASSFFIAIFSGFYFGVVLMGFTAAVLFFLLLKRFLPDRKVIEIVIILLSLIFWEVGTKFLNLIYFKYI